MAVRNSENARRWFGFRWIVIVSVLLCCVRYGIGFNVDTVNFVKHKGDPGSMFGFSVAEHRELGRGWVLVGAPEAQTRQTGVDRGGAVYRCEVTTDDACSQIEFDRTGNNNNSDGRQIDKKSQQWFGATVRSSGEDGVVLACAPRYVWFSTTTAYRRDPVGTCYIAKNQFQDFLEFSPCRTRNWGYHRQGSCQAGLGADVSKDGQRLYVGAPGSWYWQGQLYAQNPNKMPEVWATSEGSPQDDDSYLGYSVTSGDFDGRGTGGVAVGMPRGANLLGKVVLYTSNLTNLQNITGHQLGSYFSYSLAAIDVDGDSLDDLIIGAPLYSDLSNNEGIYETGRVYIYFNEPRYDNEGYFVRYRRWTFRDGPNSKSRFGLSVAALGDIDKDGYGDFAVGAPYDGESGRGAVYIYHGMRKGVRETPSQVIKGEDLSVPVSTFGFSISGGMDMDGNRYPDMVVGAYESDTAIFFRSRPVVKVTESRVAFQTKSKQINLEERPCTLRDNTQVSCTNLEACLRYAGDEVNDVLDFDIGITLDAKKAKSPRMYFLNEEGRFIKNDSMRLTKGQVNCKNYYVYIKPNIRDKLTPMEAELRYNVITRSQSSSGRRYVRSLEPALDTTEMNIRKDSISIQKNCGPDNVCIPDLRLTTKKSVSKYLLGSGEKFALDVMVENRGEDAFEAMYNLEVPQGMNFVNIERLDSDRSIPVQCSPPSAYTNNTLRCDIGNPLPKGKLVNFKVLLQPFHQEGMKPSYSFASTVNSTNPEDEFTSTDNLQRFTVPIWVETDLSLSGSSHPSEVHYNLSHYEGNITHESEIGPQVVHIYSIRNKGPANILEAQAIFLWPSYTLAGDHLLYLLEQPETSGNIKCEYVENVNEERIELDRKRKSYLESGQKAYAAERIGMASGGGGGGGGGGAGKKTSGKRKGKMSEEERRRVEEEMLRKIGDSEYESGDASLVHSTRVQLQQSGDRRFEGSGTRGGEGRGVYVTGGRGGSHGSAGSWSGHGSGSTYEEQYHRSGSGGSQTYWTEDGMHGRRVGSGFRTEGGGSGQDVFYIDRRTHDKEDNSEWGTPADTDAMRRAYGGKEFRTVALDLNSNIPVINIGEETDLRSEIAGTGRTRTQGGYGGSTSEDGRVLGTHTYSIHVGGAGGQAGERGRTGGTVHVSEGGSRTVTSGGTSTAEGGTRTHTVHVGQGGGYHQESGGRTVHVGEDGSRTYEIHVGGAGGQAGEMGRTGGTVHVSEGGSRTVTSGGTSTAEGGTRTHTVHIGQGGAYDQESGGRTVHVEEGGSRTYEIHVGGAGGQAGETGRTGGTSTAEGGTRVHTVHVGQGGAYDQESGGRTVYVGEGGSRTYEIQVGGSGEERRQGGGESGATRTQTVHISRGGSSGTYEVHESSADAERRRLEEEAARTAGGTRIHTVHVSQEGGSRTYEIHGGSATSDAERRRMEEEARAAGGTRTQSVHVSHGGSSGTYEVHGATDAERRRLEEEARSAGDARIHMQAGSGSSGTYEVHGSSSAADAERRRLEEAARAAGGSRTQTVHVTYGGSSRTYMGGTSSDDEHERRRQEEERRGTTRTQEVHVTHGGGRTYEIHGVSYDDERRRQEEEARAGGSRTYQGYDEERRREEEEARTTGATVPTTRTQTVGEGGSYHGDYDEERRRQEEESRVSGGTRTHSVHTISGSRTYEIHGGGHRPGEGDADYERRRQETGTTQSGGHVTYEGSRSYVPQGGTSGTYGHGTYDEDYERKRFESAAEAAAAAERAGATAGSVYYTTDYSYHSNTSLGADGSRRNGSGLFSWDTVSGRGQDGYSRLPQEIEQRLREAAERELQETLRRTGGRIVDGGSSRWIVYENGTIVSVDSVQTPEHLKRLREEYERRYQVDRERTSGHGSYGSYSQEEERRRLEAEAAERARAAAAGGSRHYSTEYSYNMSTSYESGGSGGADSGGQTWSGGEYERRIEQELQRRLKGKSMEELEALLDNTGGRVVEGGSSRWVVFENGTVVSVGLTENPSYEKRLREEYVPRLKLHLEKMRQARMKSEASRASAGNAQWYSQARDADYQRRLQEEMDRRMREGESQSSSVHEHYYNRSYTSESRYARHDRGYDSDLQFDRAGKEDLTGAKSDSQTQRTRQRLSGNSLEDKSSEREAKKGSRSRRDHHLVPRFKRLVEEGVDLKSSLKCGPIDCTKIMCTVGPLSRGQEAWVAFRGRIWAKTLKELGQDRVIRLSSMQASQLTKLPHIGEPESAKVETQEVFTEIMPQDTPLKTEVAPLWIWVLSACAGTLILLLLSFLLWKLGFFKRNRPSSAPEKQPLNRNGYQAGDEAL